MQKDMAAFRKDEWFKEHFSKAAEWENEVNYLKHEAKTKFQEGKNTKAIEIAKKLLSDGMSVEKVKKYTGLSRL